MVHRSSEQRERGHLVPEPRIRILSEEEALERIVHTVQLAEPGEAPFALVLGAGFSHDLVPTAREVVREDLPLWKKARATGEAFDSLKELPTEKRLAIAREFWSEFVRRNPSCEPEIRLDEMTGLPVDYAAAYRAAFDPGYIGAVGAPADAREFQRLLMRLDQPRLNAAHFLLASLLGVQPRRSQPGPSDWFKTRAAFSRLILTTNFDPFLQTALQLVNRLYFMSDTPDLGVSDEILDDHTDAIHLVYLHGSVHRRLQVADDECIRRIKESNARTLASCLKRRGVIVLGYSGWDDVMVEALAQCDAFDHRLYWCGLEPDPLAKGAFGQRVPEVLRKPTAQYVRIDGAGRFMAGLLTRLTGKLPRLLDDPIGQLRDLLEMVDLKELEAPRPAVADASSAGQLSLSGMSDEPFVAAKRSLLERLPRAKRALDGDAVPALSGETLVLKQPESTEAEAQTRATPVAQPPDSQVQIRKLLASAQLAISTGNYTEAQRLCDEVLSLPDLVAPDKATAWVMRATAHFFRDRMDDAIADWTQAIELPDAPVERVAEALCNRGVAWGKKGETDKALADFTHLIERLPDAPVELLAQALCNRGVAWAKKGETDKALADYTRVIEQLPDAPVELVAAALLGRGIGWSEKGDYCAFLADTEAALGKNPSLDLAAFNLGLALLACRRDVDALEAYRRAGQRFPDKIDSLALADLADARKKWLSEERAAPVIELLESLKRGDGDSP